MWIAFAVAILSSLAVAGGPMLMMACYEIRRGGKKLC